MFSPAGYGGEGFISMPVQNITLQCSGDESRISDCPFDNSIPSSCYSHISIDCNNGAYIFFLHTCASSCFCKSIVNEAYHMQHTVLMGKWDWWMEPRMWRGGLRFASVGDGGPSVVMGGLRQSPLSSVMTSDMRPLVRLLANNQVLWAKIKNFTHFPIHTLCRQGLFTETSSKLNASVVEGCQMHW